MGFASITENLREVRERIVRAAARAGRRPDEIRLIAVTKMQPAEAVRAALEAGVTEIGENYVQEAEAKLRELGERPGRLHLIGHLQRNKAGRAAALFDVVQTVDSPALAAALGRRAAERGRRLDVLIEVNASREAGKSGVPPEGFGALAAAVRETPGIRLRGVMGMGPAPGSAGADEAETRAVFRALRRLHESLPREERELLSMGMTGDFEWAIEEGSTLVRIGTGIFGPRRRSG